MDLVIRTLVVYLLILALTRAVGRRELSSMEPFDMILLIVIGDMVQQGVTQSDYSLTGTVVVISTLAVMTVGTSYIGYRIKPLRPLLEGEPIVLIADGEVQQENLRQQRMTLEEIETEARQSQIGSLEDVRYAILESNGKISFLTRS